ncbi:hypothetical protein Taro_054191 [Colocasia esculenta]|uniref:Uncharacterized protein n=1 Tax=Colocasia esculenta TaxID=4460 RepID=A0A843XQG2_COLES|nr:hypothetical protein [Colocasia esculenta]
MREVVIVCLGPPSSYALEGAFGATSVLESRTLEFRGKWWLDGGVESFAELSWLVWDTEDGRSSTRCRPDMAPRRRRQAKELMEKQGESDMPAQGQVQEDVAAGGQPPVPPPVVPEQHANPQVEQPVVQQHFWVSGSVGGDRENRVLGLAEGQVLGVVTVGIRARDMAPRRRRQARELMEQQGESDMPVQGQVQEDVSVEESVAQPHGAAATAVASGQ